MTSLNKNLNELIELSENISTDIICLDFNHNDTNIEKLNPIIRILANEYQSKDLIILIDSGKYRNPINELWEKHTSKDKLDQSNFFIFNREILKEFSFDNLYKDREGKTLVLLNFDNLEDIGLKFLVETKWNGVVAVVKNY